MLTLRWFSFFLQTWITVSSYGLFITSFSNCQSFRLVKLWSPVLLSPYLHHRGGYELPTETIQAKKSRANTSPTPSKCTWFRRRVSSRRSPLWRCVRMFDLRAGWCTKLKASQKTHFFLCQLPYMTNEYSKCLWNLNVFLAFSAFPSSFALCHSLLLLTTAIVLWASNSLQLHAR